jgi:ABC-2 type transport system permease protein
MAGIAPLEIAPALTGVRLARQQLRAVLWLRWRIFVNAFRFKGAAGELVAKIISYPILALMVFGPSIGAGIGAWYVTQNHHPLLLALILWGIFALWQMVSFTTSASGPSFDLSSLIRFPIRYWDYFLLRLSFGLLDPPNLIGMACLLAMTIGITVAFPPLLLWAALALFTFGATNVFFSRMVYAWLERFLAQRKTRELVTVAILFASLGFQVIAQFSHRLAPHGQHRALSPWIVTAIHALKAINWFLPPGLAANSITLMRAADAPLAFATLFGLALWATAFLFLFHRRILAQFLGENLSEAPSANPGPATARSKPIAAKPGFSPLTGILSPTVAALLLKEFRYLLRSGPKLYALVLPAFMVFIFSSRQSGLAYAGITHASSSFVFSYGCLYLQLMLVAMLYNSLGSDAHGVQFYFMAPTRLRDVLFAKNILTFGILLAEFLLIYIAAATLAQAPTLDVTIATVAGTLFIFLLSLAIGNVRSLVSPKVIHPTQVRKQNISGLNSLISLLVTMASGAISVAIFAGSQFLFQSFWPAALALTLLTAIAALGYILVYRQLDRIALEHQETLSAELCKAD